MGTGSGVPWAVPCPWCLAGALVIVGCSGPDPVDPVRESRCPVPNSEFPPTDCAIVTGIAEAMDGRRLVNLPIWVDSGPPTAYHYTSSPTLTKEDGSFELLVHRQLRLEPVTSARTPPGWRSRRTPNGPGHRRRRWGGPRR